MANIFVLPKAGVTSNATLYTGLIPSNVVRGYLVVPMLVARIETLDILRDLSACYLKREEVYFPIQRLEIALLVLVASYITWFVKLKVLPGSITSKLGLISKPKCITSCFGPKVEAE